CTIKGSFIVASSKQLPTDSDHGTLTHRRTERNNMNKAIGAIFLLAMVVLVHYASAEHKKPQDTLTRIDNVDGIEMIKPLDDVLSAMEGLRMRRSAQGGGGGGGQGQGGQGGKQGGGQGGGRRGPPDNSQGSGEN
uniref:Uncharacterized protein n=1 Tax=Anopheles arabiensis TaxID=7173 RepID=A0A182HPS6_ANOAR